jgi:hypothetical protein
MAVDVRYGRNLAALALVCAALTLNACGGDGDATVAQPPPVNPPNPPANQPPTISGTPATQVMQGTQYTFTPSASDPNGDTLMFTIANAPSWATFTASTGRLQGMPGAANVGTFSNIRISVSDGTTIVNLPAFSIAVVATATGSASLSWTPPTTNTDNSALVLTGYKVYWGSSQGSYANSVTVNSPGIANYVVDQLTPGTWYFVVTALSATGESAYSNVAQKTI